MLPGFCLHVPLEQLPVPPLWVHPGASWAVPRKQKHRSWAVEGQWNSFRLLLWVFYHSWAVLGTLCAECGAEHKQTAQAHPTPKTLQCLGNSRDTKGLQQPKQLDWGFQLSVPESCAVGPRSCVFMMMGMELTPWSFLFSGFFYDGKFESSAFLGHQGPRNLLQGKMELVSPVPDWS